MVWCSFGADGRRSHAVQKEPRNQDGRHRSMKLAWSAAKRLRKRSFNMPLI